MLINGLDDTNSERAKKVAFNIANSWIQTNYNGYKKSGYMYEKVSRSFLQEQIHIIINYNIRYTNYESTVKVHILNEYNTHVV